MGTRQQLSYLHPSDFEVVESFENILNIQHPAIKRITYQTHIKRNLSYYPKDNFTKFYSKRRIIDTDGNAFGNLHDQLSEQINANVLWNRGITGKGIKVAVFDTGLSKEHPHFRNVKERTNWTNEKSLDDGVSHGTFVSGIIASSKDCLGIAPDVELHIFRVFTNTQVS